MPTIDGEVEWIAATLVDVIEAKNPSPRVRELQKARDRARAGVSRSPT